jgi:hypothetical protein
MNESFTPDQPDNITPISGQPSVQHSPPEPEHAPGLKLLSKDVPPPETEAPETAVSETAAPEINSTSPSLHPVADISRHLKAPKLSNVKPNTISYEQAYKGININIPGSVQMRLGDTLMFYWGQNASSTRIHLRHITRDTTVRVLCVSYQLINEPQFGLVDVYYEVYRDDQLIGTSPAIRVTVNHEPTPPATPKRIPKTPEAEPKDAA